MIRKGDKSRNFLESIPGVGKSISRDLKDIGINKVTDLINKSPEKLYNDLCKKREAEIDPCVLYVFRCAVYYAENDDHESELLKWWNWKDKK